jgi:WD40 repeat protein
MPITLSAQWRKGHYKLRKLTGHTDSVNCLEFDGARVVSGGEDRTIRVWDLKTGKVERILQGHEDGVSCLQFDRVCAMLCAWACHGSWLLWPLRWAWTNYHLALRHHGCSLKYVLVENEFGFFLCFESEKVFMWQLMSERWPYG